MNDSPDFTQKRPRTIDETCESPTKKMKLDNEMIPSSIPNQMKCLLPDDELKDMFVRRPEMGLPVIQLTKRKGIIGIIIEGEDMPFIKKEDQQMPEIKL